MTMKSDLLGKVTALRADLAHTLLERETEIELALIALLTREHLLVLGPPGTAKSMLIRSLCQRIGGASYFERLLTRFSTPEEIFGPLSLAALEQDQYRRVTSGTLIEAHIGFVDEIFKANSAILNSLLTAINERIYQEAGLTTHLPLVSLLRRQTKRPKKTASMRSTTASCCVMSSRRWPTTAVSNVCSRYSPPPRLRSCRWTSSEPLKPS
jgi:MoxR-like ATPase